MKEVLVRLAVVAILVVCGAGLAQADTFSTAGASGACAPGGAGTATVSGNNGSPVNALATITIGSGTITVTLQNCTANPISISQVITDVSFTVAGASGGAFGTQSYGLTPGVISIASNGAITTASSGGNWGMDSTGPNFHLTSLGFAGPDMSIIGPGPYTSCNSSICGSGPHNPFINQIGTFTITGVTGLTEGSTITSVNISFGTTPSTTTTVPEPGTLLMFGSGLIGFGGIIRRRFCS
jgi:hypothetical protein